jgi:hypothetical protein
MEKTSVLQLNPVGSDKRPVQENTFQYFYYRKDVVKKKSIFENIKFMFVGHLIYATGVVCGFIGLCINIFKKITTGKIDV